MLCLSKHFVNLVFKKCYRNKVYYYYYYYYYYSAGGDRCWHRVWAASRSFNYTTKPPFLQILQFYWHLPLIHLNTYIHYITFSDISLSPGLWTVWLAARRIFFFLNQMGNLKRKRDFMMNTLLIPVVGPEFKCSFF